MLYFDIYLKNVIHNIVSKCSCYMKWNGNRIYTVLFYEKKMNNMNRNINISGVKTTKKLRRKERK